MLSLSYSATWIYSRSQDNRHQHSSFWGIPGGSGRNILFTNLLFSRFVVCSYSLPGSYFDCQARDTSLQRFPLLSFTIFLAPLIYSCFCSWILKGPHQLESPVKCGMETHCFYWWRFKIHSVLPSFLPRFNSPPLHSLSSPLLALLFSVLSLWASPCSRRFSSRFSFRTL